MKQYYYEVTEDDRLLGRTASFTIGNIESSSVTEERLYYASKSKCPQHATFSLREVQVDGSENNFSRDT